MDTFSGHGLGCRRGERGVFARLSFAVAGGGALVLAGPNGSGKSSLLRLMAGLLEPVAGEMRWNGVPVDGRDEAHRARLALVGHADALKPMLTARENLAFWASLAGRGNAGVDDALAAMGIGRLADTPARFLSAGQRRRLALARAIVSGAPLWLLDEPATALDAEAQDRLRAAIARHRAGGGVAVVSTHVELGLPEAATLRLDHFPAGESLAW